MLTAAFISMSKDINPLQVRITTEQLWQYELQKENLNSYLKKKPFSGEQFWELFAKPSVASVRNDRMFSPQ